MELRKVMDLDNVCELIKYTDKIWCVPLFYELEKSGWEF